jgi:hypothetical protein
MKRLVVVASLLLTLAASACGDPAKEMFDTAGFEELQNNKEHARELYGRIIEQYPESEFARKAKARLTEMGEAREKN